MAPGVAPAFVRDRQALDRVLEQVRHLTCPRCHRTGWLVGHGLLVGYAERGSEREVRGRRFYCSTRLARGGCGRSFSVLIATVIARFTVRAPTLSALLVAVVNGLSRKAAWEQIDPSTRGPPGLSLRSGYRLWARLLAAQSRLRTLLSEIVSPPPIQDARPFAQLLVHLRSALGEDGCPLAALQFKVQRGVFG